MMEEFFVISFCGYIFNLFFHNAPFLQPLKTSEKIFLSSFMYDGFNPFMIEISMI